MARALGRIALYAWLLLVRPAAADQLALLVGVTQYPNLPAELQLKAPVNDVQLMRQLLLQWGFEDRHIETLADGVPGAALPTQAHIPQALERLGRQARSGDTVVLYFAGHGSLQPMDTDPAKAGGAEGRWQPVFLPRDVRGWGGGRDARIANAIADETMRRLVDRINDSGAFVWAVFDACHSARLVRGALPGSDGQQLRVRQVSPAQLGISGSPPSELTPSWAVPRAADLRLARGAPAASRRGLAAYFYAAQSFEQTSSERLPAGGAGTWHGLFSWTLAQALARGQAMSYRQLGHYVVTQYNRLPVAAASPLYSGDGLEQPVLGRRTPPVRQWALERDQGTLWLQAGALFDLVEGAIFAVLSDPLSPPAQGLDKAPPGTLGFVRLASVQAHRSVLEPVAWQGWAAPVPRDVPTGSGARLISRSYSFALKVAVDRSGCREHCLAGQAHAQLAHQGVPGVDVRWNNNADDADLRLRLSDAGVQLLLPGEAEGTAGAWGVPVASLPAKRTKAADDELRVEALAQSLAFELHRVARTRNLLRLAAEMAPRTPPSNLALKVDLRRRGAASERPLAAEELVSVHDGDVVVLNARHSGGDPVDLAVFWLGANHSIKQVSPDDTGESPRLSAGDRIEPPIELRIGNKSVGTERLLVLSMPKRPRREAADFRFLKQGPLARLRGEADVDLQVLFDACFADYTLREERQPVLPPDSLGLQLYTFQVRR